jgi:hypothetical protein
MIRAESHRADSSPHTKLVDRPGSHEPAGKAVRLVRELIDLFGQPYRGASPHLTPALPIFSCGLSGEGKLLEAQEAQERTKISDGDVG